MAKTNSLKRRLDKRRYCTLMIWEVPKVLKKRFKDTCAKRGKPMREVILQLMTDYINACD